MCSVKKVFLEISQNLQENTVNFAESLRAASLTEHLRWLLLYIFYYQFKKRYNYNISDIS